MNPQDFKIRASQCWKIMSKSKTKGELSQTCKSYLASWYANDKDEIHSKYIDKGNEVESDLIDFMAVQLNYGLAEKCRKSASNEFMQGSCDVITNDAVIDVKAAYNLTSLHKHAIDGLMDEYFWQIVVYTKLYDRSKGIIFHGLLNTPETDYSAEIVFEDLPANERWLAYEVVPTEQDFEAIYDRVIQCREYLESYDKLIKSKLGHLNY